MPTPQEIKLENFRKFLHQCKAAGYSIVAVNVRCPEIPESMQINDDGWNGVQAMIFAGPEKPMEMMNNATVHVPVVWGIAERCQFRDKDSPALGHGFACILSSFARVYKLNEIDINTIGKEEEKHEEVKEEESW